MLIIILIVLAALWLAYGNGANDNFKGVATLYGSDTTSFKGALWWATATTLAGSLVSVAIAHGLVETFSGKGLVPDALAASPAFVGAVGLGAALTIFAATYGGMPTSTTHALIGGLLGAGIAASAPIGTGVLINKFAIPMLTSPLLAIALAALLYSLLRGVRERSGVTKETCVCIADGSLQPIPVAAGRDSLGRLPGPLGTRVSSVAASSEKVSDEWPKTRVMTSSGLEIIVDENSRCVERYRGEIAGIAVQPSLDTLHYLSAGAVCFSRAVNDTPKIAALLLVAGGLPSGVGLVLVGLAMAIGGLVQSQQVAETMSKRITAMSPGQGLTANLTTAALVLFASRLGVPVSTTHVSCGSIFGIGTVNRSARWQTIAKILLTWVTTLPAAAVISGGIYLLLARGA